MKPGMYVLTITKDALDSVVIKSPRLEAISSALDLYYRTKKIVDLKIYASNMTLTKHINKAEAIFDYVNGGIEQGEPDGQQD